MRRSFIVELLKRVKQEYGENLISFVIFGSVARGDDSRLSDLILLVLDTDKCSFDSSYRLAKALNKARRSQAAKILEEKGYSLSTEIYPLNMVEASCFRPIYLDLCFDSIIICDKESLFKKVIDR